MDFEEINDIAWQGFIEFAVKKPEMIAQFNADTGSTFNRPYAPKTGLEAAIDKATGYAERMWEKHLEDMESYILWVTEHYWGLDEAPEKVRKKIEERKNASPKEQESFSFGPPS